MSAFWYIARMSISYRLIGLKLTQGSRVVHGVSEKYRLVNLL